MKKKWFFLTVFMGIVLLFPSHNYQSMIAQGDHGRDLYVSMMTLQGAKPYQDYWWVYGPLMPYYYAGFFKVFGISMSSMGIGEMLLKLTAGIFVLLTVTSLTNALWGFVAAIWFWNYFPYFFFTYNHTGGIVILLAATMFLFRYLQTAEKKNLWWGLGAIFLFSLVKINLGICTLLSFVFSVWLIDRTKREKYHSGKRFYVAALIFLPLALGLIHWFLIKDLPGYAIRQCFPYLGQDRQYNFPPSFIAKAIAVNFYDKVFHTFQDGIFFLVILLFAIRSICLLWQKNLERATKTNLALTLVILLVFYITHLHEYLLSSVSYRMLWASPFAVYFLFFFLHHGTKGLSKPMPPILASCLIFIVCLNLHPNETLKNKHPGRYWANDKAKVYCKNDVYWVAVVEQTTQYLQDTLKPEEKFLAIPYDPIYYYMTSRPSPTRQLMFFYNNHITADQQRKIIAELKEQQVNTILFSNRIYSREGRLGDWGKTHCELLGEYIFTNYEPAASFGNWNAPAQWISNHATVIFRKKGSEGNLPSSAAGSNVPIRGQE